MSDGRTLASRWSEGWHIVPWQITWRDLDAAGHVNNAVFLSLFEWGRTRYWTEMLGNADAAAIAFIVARAEVDFLQQLGLGDEIDIATRVGAMRNSSFDFLSEIRNAKGEVAARGKVVVVSFSWSENRSQPISDELRKRIETWQGAAPV
ncbi:MAG TPA: thioesterase family protein [Thermoanaerobaculia bacterium]|nr:thioesterase family protein [Thermoanaerobaculia bacterium]